jgi:hypothetical protein
VARGENREKSTGIVWGFDNASCLYRVRLRSDRKTVDFETVPRDAYHHPRVGQAVEVLPWSAELPNGGKVAAITGHLTTVATAYDADQKTLTLADGCPADWPVTYREAPMVLYLRVWEEALPLRTGQPLTLGKTGVQVTVSGSTFRAGDYWTIGVRPKTPQAVYPWRLTATPQPPDGVHRMACPLALIRWIVAGANVIAKEPPDDCREVFDDLVDLTKRTGEACCTVVIRPDPRVQDDAERIQKALESLPKEGGCVCFKGGTYILRRGLKVKRSNVTLHGETPMHDLPPGAFDWPRRRRRERTGKQRWRI